MTTRIEEIFGPKCETYEENCPTCEVYKAIEEAHQAGIDEERERIIRLVQLIGTFNMSNGAGVVKLLSYSEIIQAIKNPDDTIKALQDNK